MAFEVCNKTTCFICGVQGRIILSDSRQKKRGTFDGKSLVTLRQQIAFDLEESILSIIPQSAQLIINFDQVKTNTSPDNIFWANCLYS